MLSFVTWATKKNHFISFAVIWMMGLWPTLCAATLTRIWPLHFSPENLFVNRNMGAIFDSVFRMRFSVAPHVISHSFSPRGNPKRVFFMLVVPLVLLLNVTSNTASGAAIERELVGIEGV